MAKKVYNADKNEFEKKKDTGPTPASNTRKKMKKAAAAKAKAPKAKKAAKAKAKEKPPVPVKRSVKDKVRVPSQAVANASTMGLKGKVADLPSKKKSGITRGGNTGDKTKAGVNRSAFNRKRKAQLGN